jgi:hypothetical protein
MRSLLVLLMLSCASSGPTTPLGQPFTLTPAKSITVDGVPITFVAIGQDSRCPPDVQCIWEGDAEVRLRVGSEEVTLHTHGGSQYPNSATVNGRTITLRELTRSPYTATLEFRSAAP